MHHHVFLAPKLHGGGMNEPRWMPADATGCIIGEEP